MNREMGSGIDWDRVNAMTDEEIERNAREENRRLGFPDDWYKTATRVNKCDGERLQLCLLVDTRTMNSISL